MNENHCGEHLCTEEWLFLCIFAHIAEFICDNVAALRSQQFLPSQYLLFFCVDCQWMEQR